MRATQLRSQSEPTTSPTPSCVAYKAWGFFLWQPLPQSPLQREIRTALLLGNRSTRDEVRRILLQRMSPLLARSRYRGCPQQCLLSEVMRTSQECTAISANDPKADMG